MCVCIKRILKVYPRWKFRSLLPMEITREYPNLYCCAVLPAKNHFRAYSYNDTDDEIKWIYLALNLQLSTKNSHHYFIHNLLTFIYEDSLKLSEWVSDWELKNQKVMVQAMEFTVGKVEGSFWGYTRSFQILLLFSTCVCLFVYVIWYVHGLHPTVTLTLYLIRSSSNLISEFCIYNLSR